MNKETLYSNMVASITKDGFRFRVRDLELRRVDPNQDWRIAALISGLRIAAAVGGSAAGLNLHHAVMPSAKMNVNFNEDAIENELNRIQDFTDFVAIKYVTGQPVILVCIHADNLDNSAIQSISRQLASGLTNLVAFSAKIYSSQMPVWAIFMPIFFDGERANAFMGKTQRECKNFGFGIKNVVLPWVFSVTARTITKHSSMPLFCGYLLNTDNIINSVFDD